MVPHVPIPATWVNYSIFTCSKLTLYIHSRWFKVTFSSLSWRSFNPFKRSLNHPKRSQKITWFRYWTSFGRMEFTAFHPLVPWPPRSASRRVVLAPWFDGEGFAAASTLPIIGHECWEVIHIYIYVVDPIETLFPAIMRCNEGAESILNKRL